MKQAAQASLKDHEVQLRFAVVNAVVIVALVSRHVPGAVTVVVRPERRQPAATRAEHLVLEALTRVAAAV